MRSTCGAR
jgi:hypothetical protein